MMVGDAVSHAEEQKVTDELYRSLGHVVFRFAELEEALGHLLFVALGEHARARAVVVGAGYRWMTDRLVAVLAAAPGVTSVPMDTAALAAHLGRLGEERNRLLHSSWGYWAETGRPVRVSRRQRPRGSAPSVEFVSMDPSEIEAFASVLSVATQKVWEVVTELQRSEMGSDRPPSKPRDVKRKQRGGTTMPERAGGRLSGKGLAKRWHVSVRHALYHKDGCWYNNLERFPGALFDPHGYLLFQTEEKYRQCKQLSIAKQTNVRGGSIQDIPGYCRMD
ncbi:MAG: hypothetical protein V9E87_07140 [Gemmatimonadales bacterium]